MRFFSRTPVRSFIIYPAVTLLWELALQGRQLNPNLWCVPLLIGAICNIDCAAATGCASAAAAQG